MKEIGFYLIDSVELLKDFELKDNRCSAYNGLVGVGEGVDYE